LHKTGVDGFLADKTLQQLMSSLDIDVYETQGRMQRRAVSLEQRRKRFQAGGIVS